MVTTVANSLFDRLIEAFPPNRPYAPAAIRRAPMPGPVADYLERLLHLKLEGVLSEDVPDGVWVDMYAPEVKDARTAYFEVLSEHLAVPALEWADALRSACHDTLCFLVQPAATLADSVFDSTSGSVRAEDVFDTIEFYPSYKYFRSVIEAYFEQKGVKRIERDRFEGLVNRIDRQMTADYTPQQWQRLLEPLREVLEAAGRSNYPIELLKSFLNDKGADQALRRLKSRYGLDGVVPFDEIDALFLSESVDEAAPTRRVESVRATERPASERVEGAVPLWKQYEQGHGVRESDSEPDRAEEPAENGEPLWKQFRKAPEASHQAAPSSLRDIERTVLGERGARNREIFVTHLFSGRNEDYEATLKRLAEAPSWSQASQIIAKEVFLKHQVNIYSDPAVAFTDAAEAQYRS